MQTKVFVSWDGDGIGQLVGRARLSDDVVAVTRLDAAINTANDFFKSWCLANGGAVVEIGGDEGAVTVDAWALKDLDRVRQQYESASGHTVSVGVGSKLSESSKALLAAKLRGKNQVVYFDDTVQKTIDDVEPEDETTKIKNEYLVKTVVRPVIKAPEESEEPALDESQLPHNKSDAVESMEDMFHLAAQHQAAKDRAEKQQKSAAFEQTKAQTAQALQALNQQLPTIEQIKSVSPETYKSIVGLVQAVIGMARTVTQADQLLTKAARGEWTGTPKDALAYLVDLNKSDSPLSEATMRRDLKTGEYEYWLYRVDSENHHTGTTYYTSEDNGGVGAWVKKSKIKHIDGNRVEVDSSEPAYKTTWAGAYPKHETHTSYYDTLQKADPAPTPDFSGGVAVSGNDQAGVGGTSKAYGRFAAHYGTISPGKPSVLKFYPLEGKSEQATQQVASNGYSHYYAGGKHGKPDLANKNYNTKHLMIYDPEEGSGGDFGETSYTDAWRKTHELAHAMTYDTLNQKYGEGRRIGGLGKQRTLREAKRAVEWEWLAAHKQRDLASQIGVNISDEDFHRELNTVMHDAVHRAVTGKFSDPQAEGFIPHSRKVPLETALGLLDDAAHDMGLADEHSLIKKSMIDIKPHTPELGGIMAMDELDKGEWSGGGIKIPKMGTPQRAAYEKNFKSALAQYFNGGNEKGLKLVNVPLSKLRQSHLIEDTKNDRVKLYTKMVAGGDNVPPILVVPHQDGYRVIDGHHRLTAATKAGAKAIPAYIKKDEMDGTELEPDKKPPGDKVLEKESLDTAHPHKHLDLPPGTEIHGQVKVRHANGVTGWKGVRSGKIQAQEDDAPLFGANSHPVSARAPKSK